jgi:hypothetical protein
MPTSIDAHVRALPDFWSSPTTRDNADISVRRSDVPVTLGKRPREANSEELDIEIKSSMSSLEKLAASSLPL